MESSSHLAAIKTFAAFVTGAKGYMFAEACHMQRRAELYDGGMPFFDGPFSKETLATASDILARTWNISEIKTSIERLRQLTNGTVPLGEADKRFVF